MEGWIHHEVTNMDAAISKTGPLVWTSSGSIASSDCSIYTHRYWDWFVSIHALFMHALNVCTNMHFLHYQYARFQIFFFQKGVVGLGMFFSEGNRERVRTPIIYVNLVSLNFPGGWGWGTIPSRSVHWSFLFNLMILQWFTCFLYVVSWRNPCPFLYQNTGDILICGNNKGITFYNIDPTYWCLL